MDYNWMIVERRIRGHRKWQDRSVWVVTLAGDNPAGGYVMGTFASFHGAVIYLLAAHYQLPDYCAALSLPA